MLASARLQGVSMPIEIERKFLVTSDAWRPAAREVVPMAQGYLNDLATVDSGAMTASVRVRIAGDQAFLNLKSRELGHTRQEFDYPIPVADARALLALCVGGVIDKRRHYIDHAGHLWEIDEFLGDNAGLVVAEIELDGADEAFAKPEWLGEEATNAPRYYNLALASRPYSQWREDEREAIDLKD
jgi:adenylate cyclase